MTDSLVSTTRCNGGRQTLEHQDSYNRLVSLRLRGPHPDFRLSIELNRKEAVVIDKDVLDLFPPDKDGWREIFTTTLGHVPFSRDCSYCFLDMAWDGDAGEVQARYEKDPEARSYPRPSPSQDSWRAVTPRSAYVSRDDTTNNTFSLFGPSDKLKGHATTRLLVRFEKEDRSAATPVGAVHVYDDLNEDIASSTLLRDDGCMEILLSRMPRCWPRIFVEDPQVSAIKCCWMHQFQLMVIESILMRTPLSC